MRRALVALATTATLALAAASSCGGSQSGCPSGQHAVYNTTTHATVCQ